MRRAAALLLLLAACATHRDAASLTAADRATIAEIERAEGLVIEQPLSVPFMYILATYYDRAKDVPNVVRWLTRLHALGWKLGLGHEFPNSSSAPEFRQIAAKLEAREPLVQRATVAFTIPKERNNRSEGIAYDPRDDVFYFSAGPATLLRVDRNGNIRDIPIEPVGQKFGRLGMNVDAERRQLWVVSTVYDSTATADEKGRSAISVYDLSDMRLVRRVMLGSSAEPAFLNDVTLLKDGTAFVTDTARGQVMRLAPAAEAFEVWASDFVATNGIATSADERTLYVADFRGLNQFDLATKSRQLLATDAMLNGIDGLVEHRGTLIGIQNVLGRPRVVRVHLHDRNRVELLESKNPLLNVPATGAVAGNDYLFMANRYEKEADRVVLKIPL
ncbi:MAG TPA: SMP-30/gluconolactonase/LRE family protein [Thermoanaerobaculia bacterium]|nr:SMP-30/gluconolactonase/LRE family protein [Thermoanaerobaculia bacterium]